MTDTFTRYCRNDFKIDWSPKADPEITYNLGGGHIISIDLMIDSVYYYDYSVKDSILTITANDLIKDKCMVEVVGIIEKGYNVMNMWRLRYEAYIYLVLCTVR